MKKIFFLAVLFSVRHTFSMQKVRALPQTEVETISFFTSNSEVVLCPIELALRSPVVRKQIKIQETAGATNKSFPLNNFSQSEVACFVKLLDALNQDKDIEPGCRAEDFAMNLRLCELACYLDVGSLMQEEVAVICDKLLLPEILGEFFLNPSLLSHLSSIPATSAHRLVRQLPDCWNLMRVLERHSDKIHCFSFNQDASFIMDVVAGKTENAYHVWNVETGKLIHTLHGQSQILSLALNSENNYLAAGFADGNVRVWDMRTNALLHRIQFPGSFFAVAYSPDGRQLATGLTDHTARLWNAQTGVAEHVLEGHHATVRSLVYSPDGQHIASGSEDKTVYLWNVETGAIEHKLQVQDAAVKVSFSPNGRRLAIGLENGMACIWNIETGDVIHMQEKEQVGWIKGLSFSPDGHHLATNSRYEIYRVWNAHTGTLEQPFQGVPGKLQSLIYSSEGQLLATSAEDQIIRLLFNTSSLISAESESLLRQKILLLLLEQMKKEERSLDLADIKNWHFADAFSTFDQKAQQKLCQLYIIMGEFSALDAKDAEGRTVLHRAVLQNLPDVVDALIKRGVDVYVQDNHGKSSLDYAIFHSYSDVLQRLLMPAVSIDFATPIDEIVHCKNYDGEVVSSAPGIHEPLSNEEEDEATLGKSICGEENFVSKKSSEKSD